MSTLYYSTPYLRCNGYSAIRSTTVCLRYFRATNSPSIIFCLNFNCPIPTIYLQLFVCQTPGIWGSLPEGFTTIWESSADVYITSNVDKVGFKFNAGKTPLTSLLIYGRCISACMPHSHHVAFCLCLQKRPKSRSILIPKKWKFA